MSRRLPATLKPTNRGATAVPKRNKEEVTPARRRTDALGALLNLSDHEIAVLAFVAALASLAVSVVSIIVARYAISKSNKNSSAATLVAVYDGFREAWQRFLGAKDNSEGPYQLSELMNLAELTCAIHSERSFVGISRELMRTTSKARCHCSWRMKLSESKYQRCFTLQKHSSTFDDFCVYGRMQSRRNAGPL